MANGGLVGILAELQTKKVVNIASIVGTGISLYGSERVVLIGVVIEPAHCVIRREVKCGTVVVW
jgi:hypothetical protein